MRIPPANIRLHGKFMVSAQVHHLIKIFLYFQGGKRRVPPPVSTHIYILYFVASKHVGLFTSLTVRAYAAADSYLGLCVLC